MSGAGENGGDGGDGGKGGAGSTNGGAGAGRYLVFAGVERGCWAKGRRRHGGAAGPAAQVRTPMPTCSAVTAATAAKAVSTGGCSHHVRRGRTRWRGGAGGSGGGGGGGVNDKDELVGFAGRGATPVPEARAVRRVRHGDQLSGTAVVAETAVRR